MNSNLPLILRDYIPKCAKSGAKIRKIRGKTRKIRGKIRKIRGKTRKIRGRPFLWCTYKWLIFRDL